MGTFLLVAFLAAHGFVHAAIWLPHPEPDPVKAVPFSPDHSALLVTAAVSQDATRQIATVLATACGAMYLAAGLGVAVGSAWASPAAGAAAILGLVLKVVFFNRWLLLGITLDVAVLSAALFAWPVGIS